MRVDADVNTGVGHVMRCLALAEELRLRGVDVSFLGQMDVLWLCDDLAGRGFAALPGPQTPLAIVECARALRLDAMVLDSYELDPACAGALRDAGVATLAIVDGDTRGQVADLYLDQNLGADLSAAGLPDGARSLTGARYALVRDAVLAARPTALTASQVAADGTGHVAADRTGQVAADGTGEVAGSPHVLCFFGGTDAYGAAPVVLRLLLATGQALRATVVVARPELHDALAGADLGPGQEVMLIPPTDRLPQLVTSADLVLSASGTSTWDLLCLGAAVALVWVVDNQRQGFDRVVSRDLAAGLGKLDDLVGDRQTADRATATLLSLLTEPRRRAELAARAWRTVDGLGRARVANALLTLTPKPVPAARSTP